MTLEDLYRLLRSGHVQAQGVVDTLEEPLLVLDGGLNVSAVNPAFLRTFGIERDEVMGQNLLQLGEGGWNTPELRALIAQVIPKAQAVIDYQLTAEVPQQGPRTFLFSARRLVQPDQRSTSILLTFDDITEAGRASAQKDILLAESQHRMRNLLGIVGGLVRQTRTKERSADEFKEAVLGRLGVLSAAQELELDHTGSVGLRTLVERALAPFLSQLRIAPGPEVLLSQAQTLPLSLVLHELSTNAVKYGGLSRPEGAVTVSWQVSAAEQPPMLVLEWTEEGGPAVTPPETVGFGTRLIAWSVSNDLRGSVEQQYEPEGLQVRIQLPLA
jgi:PAS domain S-box-containing protein